MWNIGVKAAAKASHSKASDDDKTRARVSLSISIQARNAPNSVMTAMAAILVQENLWEKNR